jgi:hypothetical protein
MVFHALIRSDTGIARWGSGGACARGSECEYIFGSALGNVMAGRSEFMGLQRNRRASHMTRNSVERVHDEALAGRGAISFAHR